MAVTDYTSYREVRTACGLTEHDISDAMLGDPMFDDELTIAMSEVTLPSEDPGPGSLAARFAEISSEAEGSRTDKEKLLLVLARLFALNVVASVVCRSISLTAAKLQSDGKTVNSRFSTDLALKLVRDSIYSALAKYKLAIEDINNSASTSYDLITVVKPTTDVVTNE